MRFVSRPVEIVIFPVKNGETPKSVVDFLRVKDTFRKNMEIVEGSVEKIQQKRIVRVQPNTLEIFEDFAFYLFFVFMCFSF